MSSPSPNPPLVLVVEDEALVRNCVVMQLEDAGFKVIEAADAEQGLRQFQDRQEVTTVFADINMPGRFDGLALAHKVFHLRPHVQLILTSGRPPPQDIEMPPGVHFLTKPYSCNSLTNLIKAA
jgi:CheY-like chemotaxis protein